MTSISTAYALIRGEVPQDGAKQGAPQKMSDTEFREFLGAMKEHLDARHKQQAGSAAAFGAAQADSALTGQEMAQADSEEEVREASEAEKKVAEGKSDAVEAFLEYIAKTPEQRYFEAFLNAKNMTEEQFQALPPAEKQSLLKEFEEHVKQHVGEATAERMARAAGDGLL
ncbi:hypothetical protein [Pelagibius sp.]|uniref:hypothetical protein n=1 Tax=Pelagibius sp. TaxID=1931238 RepID=UPI003BB1AD79